MYQTPTVNREETDCDAGPAPTSRSERQLNTDLAGRAFDIVIAVISIVFTAPLMLAAALAVRLVDAGPILFRHERIGLGGRTFSCLKFRTMVVDADERLARLLETDPLARREWECDHKLRTDPRTTPIGDFLRRSSVDELAQLFNVLRGEMSIVGPRPIVAAEVCRFGSRFVWYCKVRPGITGLWQVSGRNDLTYRRRVAMDTVYAKNKCLTWDLQILLMTLPAVIFARGSY